MKSAVFRFKQFSVQHGSGGLKVTTESILFGALVARHHQERKSVFRILDIGTGTGLLGLMLAQAFPFAHIDAVELNDEAYHQATENIINSPWCDRIVVHRSDIRSFSSDPYDLIICNPPFYHNQLKPFHNPARTMAMHTVALTYEQLATAADRLLEDSGTCYILYPPQPMNQFRAVATKTGLHPVNSWVIYQRPGTQPWRIVSGFRHEKMAIQTKEVFIHEHQSYHPQFVDYTRPFYLHL